MSTQYCKPLSTALIEDARVDLRLLPPSTQISVRISARRAPNHELTEHSEEDSTTQLAAVERPFDDEVSRLLSRRGPWRQFWIVVTQNIVQFVRQPDIHWLQILSLLGMYRW